MPAVLVVVVVCVETLLANVRPPHPVCGHTISARVVLRGTRPLTPLVLFGLAPVWRHVPVWLGHPRYLQYNALTKLPSDVFAKNTALKKL